MSNNYEILENIKKSIPVYIESLGKSTDHFETETNMERRSHIAEALRDVNEIIIPEHLIDNHIIKNCLQQIESRIYDIAKNRANILRLYNECIWTEIRKIESIVDKEKPNDFLSDFKGPDYHLMKDLPWTFESYVNPERTLGKSSENKLDTDFSNYLEKMSQNEFEKSLFPDEDYTHDYKYFTGQYDRYGLPKMKTEKLVYNPYKIHQEQLDPKTKWRMNIETDPYYGGAMVKTGYVSPESFQEKYATAIDPQSVRGNPEMMLLLPHMPRKPTASSGKK